MISGASEGKGLGNQFLRHVLKAKVFAFVADLSRYEQSFGELTNVIDEIFLYIHQRFVGSTEFGDTIEKVELVVNQGFGKNIIISCIATSADRTWTLFDKAVHLLVNKYDMVNDLEIAQELVKALSAHLSKHLSDRRSLSVPAASLIQNSFIVSAATHFGLEDWIQKISYLIASTELKTMTLLDRVDVDTVSHIKITDVTEQEVPFLLDEGYIEPKTAKRVKVREIRDEEICRLVFTLPRGNDQAEHRFWRVMLKQKHLVDFEKHGIVNGDILKVKSKYS